MSRHAVIESPMERIDRLIDELTCASWQSVGRHDARGIHRSQIRIVHGSLLMYRLDDKDLIHDF